MFTQNQTYLEKALLSGVAMLLLLATAGQSAMLADNLLTTATPLSNSSLTTQLSNSSVEKPQVLPLHRPCGNEHGAYCANGGTCMYPQDSDKPSCICEPSYSGPRCMLFQPTRALILPDTEQIIGIIFGVLILIVFLAIAVYLFAYKRCAKSALLIKSAPSETSV